ncbi:MAG: hypothetical protein WBC62_07125 [Candidatus Macondimonas sp.]
MAPASKPKSLIHKGMVHTADKTSGRIAGEHYTRPIVEPDKPSRVKLTHQRPIWITDGESKPGRFPFSGRKQCFHPQYSSQPGLGKE